MALSQSITWWPTIIEGSPLPYPTRLVRSHMLRHCCALALNPTHTSLATPAAACSSESILDSVCMCKIIGRRSEIWSIWKGAGEELTKPNAFCDMLSLTNTSFNRIPCVHMKKSINARDDKNWDYETKRDIFEKNNNKKKQKTTKKTKNNKKTKNKWTRTFCYHHSKKFVKHSDSVKEIKDKRSRGEFLLRKCVGAKFQNDKCLQFTFP